MNKFSQKGLIEIGHDPAPIGMTSQGLDALKHCLTPRVHL